VEAQEDRQANEHADGDGLEQGLWDLAQQLTTEDEGALHKEHDDEEVGAPPVALDAEAIRDSRMREGDE